MKNFALFVIPGLLLMSSSFAATQNKVSICHYDEEAAIWVLISIAQPAADAHMGMHDDALPGQATAETGALLTAACEVAAAVEAPVVDPVPAPAL